jgi:hypothetical protein
MRKFSLIFVLLITFSIAFAQENVPLLQGKESCGPSTFNLAASGAYSGGIYKWYDAPTNGNLLLSDTASSNTDTSFYVTPFLTRSDTFYVQIDSSGILSQFQSVIAKVNPYPTDIAESYVLNSLSNGLVAYYNFDGNALDQSGKGHNGVANNTSYVTGKHSSAIQMKGDQTSYVNTGNWNFPDTFSISTFFNIKDTSTGYISSQLISKYDDPTVSLFVDLIDHVTYFTARLAFRSKNNTQTYYINDTTKLYTKRWYNLIITYNGSNLVQMFIDGKLKFEKTNISTTGVYVTSTPVTIGKAYSNPLASNDAAFAGQLDDLRVYNRVLNQQEIFEINDPGKIGVLLFTDTICNGESDTIRVFRSEPGIKYQLFKNSSAYGSVQNGTGSTLSFPISNLTSTASFQINATDIVTGCAKMLDTTFIIQVNCCVADIFDYVRINPPANGLVAQYKLNGNAYDETTHGNNGTIYGAIPATDKYSKPNNAMSFKGTDYIGINNNSSLNFSTSDFSIALWIYPKAVKNMYIFGKDNYNGSQPYPFGSGYFLQYNAVKSEDIRFATRSISSNTSNFLPSKQTAPINNWTHVVGVRKNNVLKLYINGQLDNTVSETSPTNVDNSVNLKIGRSDEYTTNYFTGLMDNALIYNRALTDQEILSLYNEMPKLTVQIEDDTICYKDSTFIVINNPQPGIGYTVLNAVDSSVIGTEHFRSSDKLSISSGNITSPKSFLIYAKNPSTGCYKYLDTVFNVATCIKLQVSTTASTCTQHDGSANVQVSGGTPPYRYLWSSGDTLSTADSLAAGIYTVEVWDVNGSSSTLSFNISDISGPNITVDNVTNVSCNGKFDGAIQTTITGGTTPYHIEWSNGKTTDDINKLQAGPYEITVTDTNKCSSTITIVVKEPDVLSVSIITNEATCKASDGSALAVPKGGTQPYSYFWSNGDMDSLADNISAGIYAVIVTDANNCRAVLPANVPINNTGGPVIRFDSMTYADIGAINGALFITITGGNKPYDSIRWSNGRVTEDIKTVGAGIYDLIVYDKKGCKGTYSGQVLNKPQIIPENCIVTVDSASGRNIVVWKKPISSTISYYNIYRESSVAGKYLRIDSVLYDSFNVLLDPIAKPTVRSWRYKVSAVDKTGKESQLSDEHKTIYLAVTVGLSNTFNLAWDDYVGFPVNTYYLYRYLTSQGWVILDSMPVNLKTYTDSPPALVGLRYFVSIKKLDGACITKRWQSQGPYSQSASNMKDYSAIYVPNDLKSITKNDDIKLYPNPTNDYINITTSRKDINKIQIYDVLGNLVLETRFITSLNISDLTKGFYIVKLKDINDKPVAIERVVKE